MSGNFDPAVLNGQDAQANANYPSVTRASIWNKTLWDDVLRALAGKTVTKTATYTATVQDDLILVDATSGAVTINLPTAVQSGTNKNPLRFIVKKTDSSANAVTIDGSGSQTIDGALTLVLAAQWDVVVLGSDGANWFVLANFSKVRMVPIVSKTTTYTATLNDEVILADTSGGAWTLSLPAAAAATGKVYTVKKTSSDANLVTIDPSGSETIDGSTTKTLLTQYSSISIISNGTNWSML